MKRLPFFYGWLILAVCMMGSFFAGASSQLFISIMMLPMVADLGWSRTAATGALAMGPWTSGLFAPVAGWLADKMSPRVLMPIGAALVALTFFAMANMTELWQFYLAYAVARGVATAVMGGIVSRTALVNWFIRMRGRSMGLVSMVFPMSSTVQVPLAQLITAAYGWRAVYNIFGIAIAAVMIVLPAIIMRRRPEDMGLHPDGAASAEAAVAQAGRRRGGDMEGEFNFTAREAAATSAFWFLIVSQFLSLLINGVIGFHQVPYYIDVGLSAGIAAAAVSVYSFTGGISFGAWGFLSEHISERTLGVAAMLMAAVSLAVMSAAHDPVMAILISGVYGFAARGEGTISSLILARYFGRASYGTISGMFSPFTGLGLGLGPLVGAFTYDLLGSYFWIIWAFAVVHALAALFMFPGPPAEASPARLRPAAGCRHRIGCPINSRVSF